MKFSKFFVSFAVLIALQVEAQIALQVEAQSVEQLSLEQARVLALTRSLNLQSQMEAYRASSDSVKAQEWVYEPELQVLARQQITDRDNNNSQQTSTNRSFLNQKESLYSTRLQNLLPTGGTISLDFRITDRINNLGGTSFSPEYEREYESFAGITFEQPLLKKEEDKAPKIRIQIAKRQSEIALQELRSKIADFIARVELAYWKLYQATQETKLREESLKLARDIHAENQERVRLGKMAELELLQTESEIAKRETELEEANTELNDARNVLNTYFSQALVEANFSFVLTENPQIDPITESWEDVAADSLLNHPEYLILKKRAELAGVRLAFTKNQRLPQLDLFLSYGYNGLGESVSDSWDRLNDHDKADWTAGIQLNIPILGDRQAYYQTSAAKREKQQAILNLKEMEIQILNSSTNTFRRLESNFNTYLKSNQVVDFREKLLEVELVKLEGGKSNSRLLFEIEKELSDAKIKELEKMFEYQETQVRLLVARGQFLKERDIDITKEDLLN